ncbi:helix-turn-helix transcriptional regulator [Eubacterium ramulus]|uniref:helix-turn-helix transcriptional regulator n=1 Tax=Eubacterium ramulus TaxID=39490 RepID=UPI0030B8E99F
MHYAEALSVSELAKLCYFSEYHFMRFFKKHMNMTCIQYINNIRLEKAVELFEHGNTSILEVSLSVGFHNLSYFYRAFKAKYHMTPLAFIKRLELDSV